MLGPLLWFWTLNAPLDQATFAFHTSPTWSCGQADPASALTDAALNGWRGVRAVKAISPGPRTPAEAGISVDAARRFPEAGIPTLGVCLGHQSMVWAFGGRILLGDPVHGKEARISHDGRTIFAGLPEPLLVGRYHSLIAAPELPDCLERSASLEGVVMAVRHRQLPAEGVQFHPESVLTPDGKRLLENFLRRGCGGTG